MARGAHFQKVIPSGCGLSLDIVPQGYNEQGTYFILEFNKFTLLHELACNNRDMHANECLLPQQLQVSSHTKYRVTV